MNANYLTNLENIEQLNAVYPECFLDASQMYKSRKLMKKFINTAKIQYASKQVNAIKMQFKYSIKYGIKSWPNKVKNASPNTVKIVQSKYAELYPTSQMHKLYQINLENIERAPKVK